MKKSTVQSLLPLLSTGSSEIRLEISMQPDTDFPAENRSPKPFLVINESHPLAWITGGSFVSGSGSVLEKVFLVVQKDGYHNIHQSHRPVANPDIDMLWQESFSYHQSEQPDSFIVLPSQSDKEQQLLPYKPLFYCCQTEQFFHPPCPDCGRELQQCYDDDVLSRAGLGSYSHSIKRYLHCPNCFSNKENAAFYVHKRHSSDPPMLRDRWDLIRDFGRLVEDDSQPETLPCLSCQKVLECYSTGTKAVKRLTPFAFYNFYLFIHNAPSLHALDYLALASGASPAEINSRLKATGEYGRQASLQAFFPKGSNNFTFLFKDQGTWPVEVLFLKISFLAQFFTAVSPLLGRQSHPDLCLPIDQFWCKIAEYDRHLPFCWNFTIRPVGPGFITGNAENQYLKPPSAGLLFSMAQICFCALLFNKNNDIRDIQGTLAGIMNEQALHDITVLEQKVTAGQIPLLGPENILWDPGSMNRTDCLQPFWLRALQLGWTLFRASYSLEPGWSIEKFILELDNLAEDLRTNLLQSGSQYRVLSPSSEEASSQARDDAAIGRILKHILDRWQGGTAPSAPVPAGDADQTPIITPGISPGTSEVSAKTSSKFDKAADIDATQILQRPDTDRKTPQTIRQPSSTDEVMETQILHPDQPVSRRPQPQPGADTSQQQTEEIKQTVIISGRTTNRAAAPASGDSPAAEPKEKMQAETDEPSDKEKSMVEDLSATVIISPEDLAKLRRKS